MYDPTTPGLEVSWVAGEVGYESAIDAGMSRGSGGSRGRESQRGAPADSCFVAGTPVATPRGQVGIETLRVGQRVTTEPCENQSADLDGRADWHAVTLRMRHPDGWDDVVEIQLLRSTQWLAETGAEPGSQIDFALPEIGIQGRADVTAVDDCPTIEQGPGRLVLATVTHLNGDVFQVRFAGSADVLEPTGRHPLFSEDRQSWVRVGELRAGERLRTLNGPIEIVSITRKPGVHRVYNLEVQTDHVYYVSPLGVLAHNTCEAGFVQLTIEGRPPTTYRDILTPGEQAEFEALRANYPEWMPERGLDTPARLLTREEVAAARAEVRTPGHHREPLKFGGDPNPSDLVRTGDTRNVKNPIHTDITTFWRGFQRRMECGG